MAQQILPEIDPAACDGCGDCLSACEAEALGLVEGKAVLINPARCEYDARCEPACPAGAIALPYLIVLGECVGATMMEEGVS